MNLSEQFKLLQKAKRFESMGNADKALEFYLELHHNCTPNTSDAYERPCIILEKNKRYDEAIDLCNKAIKAIEADKMSGTKEKFLDRIENINSKRSKEPVLVEKKEEKKYAFGIIGFRHHNKLKMISASIFYLITFILCIITSSIYPLFLLGGTLYGVVYFVNFFQTEEKKTKRILFILMMISFSLLIYAVIHLDNMNFNTIVTENKEGIENSDYRINNNENKEEIPTITKEHIKNTCNILLNEVEVEDNIIIVEGDMITFGLLLKVSTSTSSARDLIKKFKDTLSDIAYQDNKNILKKSEDLYTYYSIKISAYTPDNVLLAKARKNKASKFLKWDK